MLLFIASSVVLFPLAFLSHPAYGATVRHLLVPGIQGGVSSDAILLIIAIVGTTVAPWQLFFQQSNVVDKRITPRFIGYERADTFLGSIVVVVGAGALMIAGAYAVSGTALAGHFTSALGVAQALQAKDQVLGALFAIVLLDASIIGAAAVTLSTSYAFGDFFGLKHSLHRSFRDAKGFYGAFTALVIVAAGIVLIPGAPLGVVTEAVQALAGLLLPSASVFLLLLCNDREVLGPWVNRGWLNVVATTIIIAALLMLSGTLMATTLFPHPNAARMAIWLSAALAVALAAAGIALRLSRARRGAAPAEPRPRTAPAGACRRWPYSSQSPGHPPSSSACSPCAATSSSPYSCCSSRPSSSAPAEDRPHSRKPRSAKGTSSPTLGAETGPGRLAATDARNSPHSAARCGKAPWKTGSLAQRGEDTVQRLLAGPREPLKQRDPQKGAALQRHCPYPGGELLLEDLSGRAPVGATDDVYLAVVERAQHLGGILRCHGDRVKAQVRLAAQAVQAGLDAAAYLRPVSQRGGRRGAVEPVRAAGAPLVDEHQVAVLVEVGQLG